MLFQIVTITKLEDLSHFSACLEPQNGLVRKNDFRENALSTMYKWLLLYINYSLTFLFVILNKYQNLLPLVEDPKLVEGTGEDRGGGDKSNGSSNI